mmetsp:Transcript_16699/g.56427  ORF Transcript_16699/g.56427 Transcript_16699/m.56427 type:complete len:231 (+) Transcript_16699:185-877(+)
MPWSAKSGARCALHIDDARARCAGVASARSAAVTGGRAFFRRPGLTSTRPGLASARRSGRAVGDDAVAARVASRAPCTTSRLTGKSSAAARSSSSASSTDARGAASSVGAVVPSPASQVPHKACGHSRAVARVAFEKSEAPSELTAATRNSTSKIVGADSEGWPVTRACSAAMEVLFAGAPRPSAFLAAAIAVASSAGARARHSGSGCECTVRQGVQAAHCGASPGAKRP